MEKRDKGNARSITSKFAYCLKTMLS